MLFADLLIDQIKQKSPICVGLDPDPSKIPSYLLRDYSLTNAILRFNQEIIDAVADLVPVIKPQVAYYEKMGIDGLKALKITIEHARKQGLIVIADGKRNDIGSTSDAYADAFLKTGSDFESDALTVNPYLGSDGILPFVNACSTYNKGLFVLLKTSNPSSGEFQDLKLENGEMLYERVADYISSWGENIIGESGYSSIGSVVGAYYPEVLYNLRVAHPRQIFLVPGYGAQGATAEDLRCAFDALGGGAIINSSRGIIYAYKDNPNTKEQDFAQASRDAVIKMSNDLKNAFKVTQ